jgi:hypothetical protein
MLTKELNVVTKKLTDLIVNAELTKEKFEEWMIHFSSSLPAAGTADLRIQWAAYFRHSRRDGDISDFTLLSLAAEYGRTEYFDALLQHLELHYIACDLDKKKQFNTIIHESAIFVTRLSDSAFLKKLLRYLTKEIIDAYKTEEPIKVYHWSDEEYKFNARFVTLLSHAVCHERQQNVELLLAAGANLWAPATLYHVDDAHKFGYFYPVDYAAHFDSSDMLKLLLLGDHQWLHPLRDSVYERAIYNASKVNKKFVIVYRLLKLSMQLPFKSERQGFDLDFSIAHALYHDAAFTVECLTSITELAIQQSYSFVEDQADYRQLLHIIPLVSFMLSSQEDKTLFNLFQERVVMHLFGAYSLSSVSNDQVKLLFVDDQQKREFFKKPLMPNGVLVNDTALAMSAQASMPLLKQGLFASSEPSPSNSATSSRTATPESSPPSSPP